MVQMMDLAHKEFKAADTNVFRYLKEEMDIINEYVGNTGREMELLKSPEILGLKSTLAKIKINWMDS